MMDNIAAAVLSGKSGEEIFRLIEERRRQRAEKIPDVQAALRQICEAVERLRELGWRDGIYAPKDGRMFEIVEAGSTGIFQCHYSGEWPDGFFNTMDGQDVYPSRSAPMMFRELQSKEPS